MNRFKVISIILLTIGVLVAPGLMGEEYYWVGNSGNWSDINHWAVNSGGSVLHSQTPTANDDVYFDQNSFTEDGCIVVIDHKNAVCKDMLWAGATNNPVLSGHDTTSLRIYGSLSFINNMQMDYQGIIYFEATNPGQTVSLADQSLKNHAYFQGEGGGWQLEDKFTSQENIYFLTGDLITNDYTLACQNFISSTQTNRYLDLGESTVEVTNWEINGVNLQMNAQNAFLIVGSSLKNIDGEEMIYDDIHFIGAQGVIINAQVWVTYNNVFFDYSGGINGDCKIDTLNFGSSGIINDSDTITYVKVGGEGIINGSHIIDRADLREESSILGHNKINFLTAQGLTKIAGNNNINEAILAHEAEIDSSNAINHITVEEEARIKGSNIIRNCLLNGDGYFRGQNTFDTLIFSPGKSYIFGIESTQTIKDELTLDANCSAPIRLLADTNGVQSTIHKVNGPVEGDFLSIRDIKASGNVPFIANQSVDLGNNTNWEIDTSQGIDLYWVNGDGHWDDPNHWDAQSGGSGGHCPPTELDNALFDENSFSGSGQAVMINVDNAVCRDMIWEGAEHNPSLQGSIKRNLRIYGSLTLIGGMNLAFSGEIYFEATEKGETITSAGNIYNNNTWYTGRGGSWAYQDEYTTEQTIYLQQGELFTSSVEVTCNDFQSTDTTTRALSLGTSEIYLNKASAEAWSLNAQNLTFDGDSSFIYVKGLAGQMKSFSGNELVYNDVEFWHASSALKNEGTYCYYDLVTFKGAKGEIRGNCTIDTATFYGPESTVFDSDTIKTVIFLGKDGLLKGGNHIIEIAYFYKDGQAHGSCVIDTALFYERGIISDTNTIDTTIIHKRALIKGKNNIRTATLKDKGTFSGSNSFGTLTLTQGNKYIFQRDSAQTITEQFNINGACTGPIFLYSNEVTHQAIINKPTGQVTGDYLVLRDMKAVGEDKPFIANNSVGLSNNDGWQINASEPKDLYWVGGSGVWSDSLHWSAYSGGDGGYCIPSPKDDVYFDENSFPNNSSRKVTVDIENATCHNMDWTGAKYNPRFMGADSVNLRIYGSLTFIRNMRMSFGGRVFFESTEKDQFIDAAGQQFSNLVYFLGIGGEWALKDSLQSAKQIYFKHGTLDAQQNYISCSNFNSNYDNPRELDLDSCEIVLTGTGTETWFIDGENLEFTAKDSKITSTGPSSVFRVENGGPFDYHKVRFLISGRIYNNNTEIAYDHIRFHQGGEVHGNCSIDSVIFDQSGFIYDSDQINYAHIKGSFGGLIGGSHQVETILFNESGQVSGNNTIDSTSFGGNASVNGINSIGKTCLIGGTATISGNNTFDKLTIRGDGIFNNQNEFNELEFTPGNKYELEEGIKQTIYHDFRIRGNNCFPIVLRSQHEGEQADIFMPSGTLVSGDFIELRDINATGGGAFYAGNFSTDISNNTGWSFTNSPGYIFGFPRDTTVCTGLKTEIGTEFFNPGPKTTFLWHDGSTGDSYRVSNEDSIWVKVFYADDCFYTDTLLINYRQSPTVDLGDDRQICTGDTIYPWPQTDTLSYLWYDSTTNQYTITEETGHYWLEVTDSFGCKDNDSVYVEALPTPDVFLGSDTTLPFGGEITLDAGFPDASHFWSTGDTTRQVLVPGDETYWVEVTKDGCLGSDTIYVGEYPECILAVPTAFSPNGDGHNDMLRVRGNGFREFELLIFNRLGELVFSTKNSQTGWDGTYQGKQQEMDVYTFYLKGTCTSGRQVVKKGSITLLK
ncbi:MAG: gliding motility-associated C-terminal domain-containing protein [Bacteroidales bacterium]|nr:gliding motility-associated C-terminal domain-containing protein [Bacteroidales bacterium]